ncbi:putative membrane protein YedE/YeeE [Bradyrhizobium sp. LB1.3]
MESSTQLVIFAGLVIGLVYGAVGLLSGFCLMSSMRGWLAEGDGRLVRTYALAIAVATAASQFFAGNGMVDLGKSIYLQQSFSVPVLLLGGLLFGYGMVLSNGCGSRALVLLGRGNLRSFVVVVVLAIAAQMTLKGLIAPARIALVQASQTTVHLNSLPSLLATFGPAEAVSRAIAAAVIVVVLILFAFAHPPFRRSHGQIAAGAIVGLLVAGGWFVTGYLGADDFNPVPVTSLTFIAPIADALQYAMLSTGLTLNFGIATVGGVLAGSLATALVTGPIPSRRLFLATPHAAIGGRRRPNGHRRRDGLRLFDRARAHWRVDARAGLVRRRRRHPARHHGGPARSPARSASRGGLTA